MMPIKYGLIGTGMMGQEHIRNLNLIDDCEIVALADSNEEMRSKAKNLSGNSVATFSNYKDLLNANMCDAIIIATPNDTHHQILLAVLEQNLPILCEKPLCTSSVHCREVIKKASTNSCPIWVAMEYRYMPPLQKLLTELANGIVGNPRMVAIREHRFPFLEKVEDWNRFSKRTGGTLVEKCCHFWDLMRLILNCNPIRVFASAGINVNHLDEVYEGRTPDIIDNAFVIVEFENEKRAVLDLCMFAEATRWQEEISVTGEKARIDARVPGPIEFLPSDTKFTSEVEIFERGNRTKNISEIGVEDQILSAGSHFGSTYYQHLKFLKMLQTQSNNPEVSLNDGLWSVIIGEAAEKSAKTNQPVEIKF